MNKLEFDALKSRIRSLERERNEWREQLLELEKKKSEEVAVLKTELRVVRAALTRVSNGQH